MRGLLARPIRRWSDCGDLYVEPSERLGWSLIKGAPRPLATDATAHQRTVEMIALFTAQEAQSPSARDGLSIRRPAPALYVTPRTVQVLPPTSEGVGRFPHREAPEEVAPGDRTPPRGGPWLAVATVDPRPTSPTSQRLTSRQQRSPARLAVVLFEHAAQQFDAADLRVSAGATFPFADAHRPQSVYALPTNADEDGTPRVRGYASNTGTCQPMRAVPSSGPSRRPRSWDRAQGDADVCSVAALAENR